MSSVWPCPSGGSRPSEPKNTTWCGQSPRFDQVSVEPTGTVTSLGAKIAAKTVPPTPAMPIWFTGAPGAASGVTRTIEVVLRDNFFEPESIRVKPGETIRFKIINAGEFVHEFNIGTAEMHAEHQGEMAMMVEHNVLMPDRIDMKAAAAMQASMGHGMHDDPNSVLLEPGHTGEVIWTFPEGGEIAIEFGCNVPGHYEAGMVGEFEVQS